LGSFKNQEKPQKSKGGGGEKKAKISYEKNTSGVDHHLSIQNKKSMK
jgi:hypothetical protein